MKSHIFASNLSIPMTDVEYHKHPSVSNSSLGKILKSPAHYQAYLTEPRESTAAQHFGSLFHKRLLEPELYKSSVCVDISVGDKRKKENQEKYQEFLALNVHREVVSIEQSRHLEGMTNAVFANSAASKLLLQARNEQAFFWHDLKSGVDCKCKPDVLREGHIIVDIKTTRDASRAAFGRDAFRFGYHRQAAFYLRGLSAVTGHRYDTFLIVAVEKEPPYGVTVHVFDDTQIQLGEAQVEKALKLYKECSVLEDWPSYDSDIKPLSYPAWAGSDE